MLSKNEQRTCWILLRQAVYFGLAIGFILSFRILANCFHEATFQEFGIIENIQLILLTLSALFFLSESLILKNNRALLEVLSALCVFAFCRELDSFFDETVPIISWKFAFLFPALAMINLWQHRKEVRISLFQFLESPAFWMMVMAIGIGVVLAQCLGHRPMIAAVLGNSADARLTRRILEEGSEIVGYLWIWMASIEFYFDFRHKK